jgi:hypothetical protein
MCCGAGGDGVGDDTAAFLAVAAAIVASDRGGAVYIPTGLYKITSTITFDLTEASKCLNLQIYGDGGSSRIVSYITNNTDLFYILGNKNGATGNVVLRDFDMYDYAWGANTGSATAIHLRRIIHSPRIQNVSIRGFVGGKAIHLQNTWMAMVTENIILDNKYGVYSDVEVLDPGTTGATTFYTVIDRSEIQACEIGVYYPNSNSGGVTGIGLEIRNCIIEGNEGSGIDLYGVQHVRLLNIYAETNNTGGAATADICLRKCLFIFMENCYTVGSTGDYLYTDGDTNSIVFMNNNIQDTVNIVGSELFSYKGFGLTSGSFPSAFMNIQTSNLMIFDLAEDDATPAVNNPYIPNAFYTKSTNPTTITNFDNGWEGQAFTVIVNDANTTFDFSGSSLKGNGGVDFVAAAGDAIRFIKHGSYWYGTVFDIG